MCKFSVYGVVKIEHTVGGHNHDILQQCISDVYARIKSDWAPPGHRSWSLVVLSVYK